jgi:CRP/FNR family cyclic AMP-dependent transcriptional regulator
MTNSTTSKITDFFAHYPLRTFDKRQLIIRAEGTVSSVFYVVEGRVGQYDVARSGNEIFVNAFKPGAFFPMSSVINNVPNDYLFEASTQVVAHEAPAAEVVQFLHDNPDVLFDLLSRVYRGMDGVLRRMAHLMGGNSKSRLLFELLNAAYRFGEPQPDGRLLLPLSEVDLAKHSGLARETVNRSLQSFKTTGLVEVARHGIVLKDVEELETLLNAGL